MSMRWLKIPDFLRNQMKWMADMNKRGRFRIWCPDLGQEEFCFPERRSMDAQSAAEEWAEWRDRQTADYDIVGGAERRVFVRDIDSNAISEWDVTGEAVPQYTATKVLQHI